MTVPAVSLGFIKIPIIAYLRTASEISRPYEEVSLYPNPTGSYFTVSVNCLDENCNDLPLRIEIYNMQGVRCITQQVVENEKIDVNLLPAGIYGVFINASGHETICKPLIKQ